MHTRALWRWISAILLLHASVSGAAPLREAMQEPEVPVSPENTARSPLTDIAGATRVLTALSSPREARRDAAVALLFQFGEEGLARVELALENVLNLPLDRELTGTVEGQVVEALREALEMKRASGVDFDASLLRVAPHLVRLVARNESLAGGNGFDASRRALLALLQSNLRARLLEGWRALLAAATEAKLRRAALLALARLRLIELCPEAAAIAFGVDERVALRRLAQDCLIHLTQQGFKNLEEFELWREQWMSSEEPLRRLAWGAGDRLRDELFAARLRLVTHAAGDLDVLLPLMEDPSFPAVRAGAARELAVVVARFDPEQDADPLRRVMSALDLGVRNELYPEVLVEMTTCLRNLAPLVSRAEKCVADAGENLSLKERCEQFRLHIKPLRDLVIELAPAGLPNEEGQWVVRARAVEALRWFPSDLAVQTHMTMLLEQIVTLDAAARPAETAPYVGYRRSVFATMAELQLSEPPAARAMELMRRLSADVDLDLRRSAVPLLRAYGRSAAIGVDAVELLFLLGRSEAHAGVRADALLALADLATSIVELRPRVIEAYVAALSSEDVAVRRSAAEWFVKALGEPLWSSALGAVFGPLAESRLAPLSEPEPNVRALLGRGLLENLRVDWLEIALLHLSRPELSSASRWMRLALERPNAIEERKRIELVRRLGERLPETAFAILYSERRIDAEAAQAVSIEERDRLLLMLGWEAFARLERFEASPRELGAAERTRLQTLQRRSDRWPAFESEQLARVDLDLRLGQSERALQTFGNDIDHSDLEQRGARLDRLIAANWRLARWTDVASWAGRRVAECGQSPSWWVSAMVFEARLARDREEGRMSSAERLRQANLLITATGGTTDRVLNARRRFSLMRIFERQGRIEDAKAILKLLEAEEQLPRDLTRDIASAIATYR